MTEEEKKAIDILKDFTENEDTKYWQGFDYETILSAIECLLNLIEKQKEEIERLKNAEDYSKLGKETLLDTIHKQQKEIEELKFKYQARKDRTKTNYISKDKIINKMKDYSYIIEDCETILNRTENEYIQLRKNRYVNYYNCLKDLLEEGDPNAK